MQVNKKWSGVAAVLVLAVAIAAYAAWSQGYLTWADTGDDEDEGNSAQLIQDIQGGTVPLSKGLSNSQAEGIPISGKFEVEDGNFQLSVYTQKGQNFSEVVLDPKTGAVRKVIPITGGEDLAAAKAQSQAMAEAKKSLTDVIQAAEKTHPGAHAVSVFPGIQNGKPAAEVTVLAGNTVQKVPEPLD